MTFTYTAPNNQAAVFKVIYSTYTIKTNFGCTGLFEYGPTNNNLVSEIDLPDHSKYSFNYEPTPGYSGDRSMSIRAPSPWTT